MARPYNGVIAGGKLVTRIRKAKKTVDGIPENVKMGERKEENWAQYKKDQENLKDRDEFNITSLMGKKIFLYCLLQSIVQGAFI